MTTPRQAAQQILLLRQQAKEYEAQADALATEFFRSLIPGDYAEGNFKVSVQRNARFDPSLAKQVLSEEQFQEILVTKPDSAKAKDTLPPALYRQTQKESAPKVTVTLMPEEED